MENMLLLTVPQAARLLGMSPRRLYALAAQGAFPDGVTIRLGRAVRLSGPRLWRWLGVDDADTAAITQVCTKASIASVSVNPRNESPLR
jgi:predicted DNA-binding transcriptional regulator AlpA